MDLAGLRRDYRTAGLEPSDLGEDPHVAFGDWLAAHLAAVGADANAVVLATSDPDTGRPSARTVLLKGLDDGRLVFYTNRRSRKGRELAANPQATLLFSWVPVSRQITIEGSVEPLSDEASDAYFSSRPRPSQLAAWASPQSSVIADRAELEEAMADATARHDGADVPRPPHWGGFALTPDRFEFWQGRENRLHDRVEYVRDDTGDGWTVRRLAP